MDWSCSRFGSLHKAFCNKHKLLQVFDLLLLTRSHWEKKKKKKLALGREITNASKCPSVATQNAKQNLQPAKKKKAWEVDGGVQPWANRRIELPFRWRKLSRTCQRVTFVRLPTSTKQGMDSTPENKGFSTHVCTFHRHLCAPLSSREHRKQQLWEKFHFALRFNACFRDEVIPREKTEALALRPPHTARIHQSTTSPGATL